MGCHLNIFCLPQTNVPICYILAANHIVDPRISLAPNAGASDRSWVWNAFDFSDGELEEKVIYF